MAQKYWDGTFGSDSNNGSYGAPWKTFTGTNPAAFLSAAADGDICYLSGTFRPASVAALNSLASLIQFTSKTGVTFKQWIADPELVPDPDVPSAASIRGDALIAGVWTSLGSNRWSITITAGLGTSGAGGPSGMTCNYDTSTFVGYNSHTLHYGVMKPVAGSGAAWTFEYTSATGVLTVNTPSIDPNSAVMTIVRGGGETLVTFTGCTRCVLDDVDLLLNGINLGGGSFGFAGDTCTGCTLSNLRIDDTSAHNQAWLGTSNTDNVCTNVYGGAGGQSSTCFVTFSTGGNSVTGCRFTNCEAHVLGYRNGSNSDLFTPITIQGFYGHCDGSSASRIEDVEYNNCWAYIYTPLVNGVPTPDPYSQSMDGFGIASVGNFAGNWYDTTGRKARYYDCGSVNDTGLIIGSSNLYQRCSFRFPNAGPSMPGGSLVLYCIKDASASDTVFNPLFDSCEIITNMTRTADATPSGYERFIRPLVGTYASGDGINFLNSTLVNTGTGTNGSFMVDYNLKTNFTVRCYGSIIGHLNRHDSNAKLCQNDDAGFSIDANRHEFRQNIYLGISPEANGYSYNTAFDNEAEWRTNIDSTNMLPLGQVADASAEILFTAIATNAALTTGSPAISLTSASHASATSLNGGTYYGCYGAYQYVLPQFARPTSTESAVGWLNQAGSSTNIWNVVDETIPNDEIDFIVSPTTTAVCRFAITALSDPNVSSGHIVRTRYAYVDGVDPFVLTVRLKEGSTIRASKSITVAVSGYTLAPHWVEDIFTLSATQANNITDYSNLKIEVVQSVSNFDEIVEVTYLEFQCPQATAPSVMGGGRVRGGIRARSRLLMDVR